MSLRRTPRDICERGRGGKAARIASAQVVRKLVAVRMPGGSVMSPILVLFGALALGQAGATASQSIDQRPKIIVDGYGEVKTMPDVATISYTLRGEGKTSDEAVRAMVAMGERVDSGIRSIDASVEPKTGTVEVNAIRAGDCQEREYGPRQMSTGPCSIIGYVALQQVTVKTGAIDAAGTMVGLVGRAGAYDAELSGFGLRDPRPAKREAIAAALQDANAKAAAIAASSRFSLGQILSVSSVGRDTGQDIIVTGSRQPQPNLSTLAPAPVDVKLTPEPITTSATVTVTYGIQQ